MKAKIELPWTSALLDNQANPAGDKKLGNTQACQKAMWDIVLLLRSKLFPMGWKWNGERIQVEITACRPRSNIDAQNLVKKVCDAIENAINVDDKHYDVSTKAIDDKVRPRIEIEISQDE